MNNTPREKVTFQQAQLELQALAEREKAEIENAMVDMSEPVLIDEQIASKTIEIKGKIESVMGMTRDQIVTSWQQAKNAPAETFRGVTGQPVGAASASRVAAADLKRRLDWGEPALTIVDVRHRELFNQERIRGAVSMPEADLISVAADALESEREIFVYGDTALQAEQSLLSLREAGFEKVACIRDGIPGWKKVGGATEGTAA